MKLKYNETEGEVSILLDKKFYRTEHLSQAAFVFSKKATAFMSETADRFDVTLKSRVPLELISEERRFEVSSENKRIIELIVTQALYSAQQTPEQEAEATRITNEMQPEAERLMAEIRAETAGKAEALPEASESKEPVRSPESIAAETPSA